MTFAFAPLTEPLGRSLVACALSFSTALQAAVDQLVVAVRDGDGLPVSGSVVGVSARGYPAQNQTADADGVARFAALMSGEYSVTISFPGFANLTLP